MSMDFEKLDLALKKIGYKIGMTSYLVKLLKKEIGKTLSKEEFSSLLCSGIVPIMVGWAEADLFAGDVNIDEARKMLDEAIKNMYT